MCDVVVMKAQLNQYISEQEKCFGTSIISTDKYLIHYAALEGGQASLYLRSSSNFRQSSSELIIRPAAASTSSPSLVTHQQDPANKVHDRHIVHSFHFQTGKRISQIQSEFFKERKSRSAQVRDVICCSFSPG